MGPAVRAGRGAIVSGGLMGASIDVGATCLISGRSVLFIVHTIAAGILAKAARLGLSIASVCAGAARRVPVLLRCWTAFGAAYGVIILVVMNFVVVPLSAWKVVPTVTPFGSPPILRRRCCSVSSSRIARSATAASRRGANLPAAHAAIR